MIARPIKTPKITAGSQTLIELLDNNLAVMPEAGILAITSKIVSLCENRVAPNSANKEDLIKQEASHYLPSTHSSYGHHFTITKHTLIGGAGIDQSNGGDNYILWPQDPQATANQVWQYLKDRFKLQKVGVVIIDSTSTPLRLGASGLAIGFSGFKPLNDYIGKPDLFGKPFSVSRANVAGGLAATAVLVMGEGTEQTPLAIIEDLPLIKFSDQPPTTEDLETLQLSLKEDLFAPFLTAVDWLPGDKPN